MMLCDGSKIMASNLKRMKLLNEVGIIKMHFFMTHMQTIHSAGQYKQPTCGKN